MLPLNTEGMPSCKKTPQVHVKQPQADIFFNLIEELIWMFSWGSATSVSRLVDL